MDTYVIRIYRREESGPHGLAGIVEGPGVPGKKDFVNLEQLWDILNSKKKKPVETKKKDKGFRKERKP